MISTSAGIFINAPQQKIFNIAADGHQQMAWDSGNFTHFEMLSPPPVQKGTKCQCRVKGMGKMTYEFAEYKPYSVFVHTSVTRMAYGTHYFSFEEKDAGTMFLQKMELRLRGIFILLTPFIKPSLTKTLNNMNKELKNYCESQNPDTGH